MRIKTLKVDFIRDDDDSPAGVVTVRLNDKVSLSRSLNKLPPADKQKIERAFTKVFKFLSNSVKDL